jgi:hypothetical protein
VTVGCNLGVKQRRRSAGYRFNSRDRRRLFAFERSRCGVRRTGQRFSRNDASVVVLLNAVVIVGRGGVLRPQLSRRDVRRAE